MLIISINKSSSSLFLLPDKIDSEKAEIFCKIEPYLTLIIPQLERQGADIQTKLERVNQSLRNRRL
jgi:hypothetical protein